MAEATAVVKAPKTGIYWCSVCKTPVQFKEGEEMKQCRNLCGRGKWEFVQELLVSR